jgi:hypothetical protein
MAALEDIARLLGKSTREAHCLVTCVRKQVGEAATINRIAHAIRALPTNRRWVRSVIRAFGVVPKVTVVEPTATPQDVKTWLAQSAVKRFDCHQWVYLLQALPFWQTTKHKNTELVFKIGIAFDPGKRAKKLRNRYSHYSIAVVHAIGATNAYDLEAWLHWVFADKQGGGPSWEWFRLDKDDVAYVKGLTYIDMKRFKRLYTRHTRRREFLTGCECA